MSNTFIIDNGGFSIKAGYSSYKEPKCLINAVMKAKSERRRPFIGDQIEECRDASGLFYILPFQRGYLINWDVQKTIWDYIFGKEVFNVNFTKNTVVITEPIFNFTSIQEGMSEIFFEEYEVDSLLRINSSDLCMHRYHKTQAKDELCCVVIDSGYSFTHIIPYIQKEKQKDAICRIDIGGKVMTNNLKELISYRQLNVMDETYVVNQVKEDSCYVCLDFNSELHNAKNNSSSVVRDYVLPDFTTIRRGFLKSQTDSTGRPEEGEQIIRLNNERFSIPELLFSPSDVGVQEMGICEAIVHCINKCPSETRPHLYNNIILTGGNCNLPFFKERVYKDVRSMAPDEINVRVILAENPSTYAWHGGVDLSESDELKDIMTTKQQWEEHGFYGPQM